MDADGLFELLYVFGSSFSEGSLGLPVSLLTFFRRSVNLGELVLVVRNGSLFVVQCNKVK